MKCAVQSPRKVIVKKETVNTLNESPGLVKTKINTHAKGREQGQSCLFWGGGWQIRGGGGGVSDQAEDQKQLEMLFSVNVSL